MKSKSNSGVRVQRVHRNGLVHVLHHVRAEAVKEISALSFARCDLLNALSSLNHGRLKDAYMMTAAAQRQLKLAIGEAQQNDPSSATASQ